MTIAEEPREPLADLIASTLVKGDVLRQEGAAKLVLESLSASALVDELVDVGAVAEADRATAVALLREIRPAAGPAAPPMFPFASDSDFLHRSIGNNVNDYLTNVLLPTVMTYHSRNGLGRLIRDKEVSDAVVAVSGLVMGELGEPYVQHMTKYFGSDGKLEAYVIGRVRRRLIDEALAQNEKTLVRIGRKRATAVMTAPPPPAG